MKIKNDVFVYAEGGGSGANSAALQAEFRQAFAEFLSKTELGKTRRPRVVTCGGREQAFNMFRTAIGQGKNALLLVDSEESISPANQPPPANNWRPWAHLQNQANWQKPVGASDDDCHFMAPCMEIWFLTDGPTVLNFFGQGFDQTKLPAGPFEAVSKQAAYTALAQATRGCKTKGTYGKGTHSFKLLALIDPVKVTAGSQWAKRFLDELAKRKP